MKRCFEILLKLLFLYLFDVVAFVFVPKKKLYDENEYNQKCVKQKIRSQRGLINFITCRLSVQVDLID